MAQTTTLPATKSGTDRAPIVNECSIQVATVNGSGSQTANNTLLRAIFQMGIPVSGKNLFPSNIAGLPTWFTIRANKHGYVARRKEIDVLVCMNSDTAVDDVKAAVRRRRRRSTRTRSASRSTAPTSCSTRCRSRSSSRRSAPTPKLRKLVVNMIYVGVVAQLLAHRRRRDREGAVQGVLEEAEGPRAEQGGRRGRPRVRAREPRQARPVPRRADGQERGQDPDRRQHRRRHRRACSRASRSSRGTRSRRRASLCESADRLPEGLPHRPGHGQGDLRGRAGRGRAGRDRHGDRRRLGGRALHDDARAAPASA